MKLLKNSIDIKISKLNYTMDKLRAIILIQIKIITKYEDFMTIVLSQIWGHEPRNILCRNKVIEYIKTIQELVEEGIKNGEIVNGDSEIIASRNFWINLF